MSEGIASFHLDNCLCVSIVIHSHSRDEEARKELKYFAQVHPSI